MPADDLTIYDTLQKLRAVDRNVGLDITSYREYQREVSSKFKAAKKEMQVLKDKQQEMSDRMKTTESTLVEMTAERRNANE